MLNETFSVIFKHRDKVLSGFLAISDLLFCAIGSSENFWPYHAEHKGDREYFAESLQQRQLPENLPSDFIV